MSVMTLATVTSVTERTTKNGKNLVILAATDGEEYSAFDPGLCRQARGLEGKLVKIEYDESERNGYKNRYIRSLQPVEGSGGPNLGDHVPPSVSAGGPSDQMFTVTDIPEDAEEGGWVKKVSVAASRGEWRAAESLARQEHIERSVALNNAVTFFSHMREEDRKLTNLVIVFEHMLEILKGTG